MYGFSGPDHCLRSLLPANSTEAGRITACLPEAFVMYVVFSMIFWLKLHIMLMFSLNSFSAGIAYSFSLPTVFLNSFSGCLLLYSKSAFVTTSNLISVQFDFPVSISRTDYLSVYCSPEEDGPLTYSRLLRFKNALSPISLYKPIIYIDLKSFFIQ